MKEHECESVGCVNEADFQCEGGEWACRDHFPPPPLVIELRYSDGNDAAYRADDTPENKAAADLLWRQLADPAEGGRIVIRAADDEVDPADGLLGHIYGDFGEALDAGHGDVNGADLLDILVYWWPKLKARARAFSEAV